MRSVRSHRPAQHHARLSPLCRSGFCAIRAGPGTQGSRRDLKPGLPRPASHQECRTSKSTQCRYPTHNCTDPRSSHQSSPPQVQSPATSEIRVIGRRKNGQRYRATESKEGNTAKNSGDQIPVHPPSRQLGVDERSGNDQQHGRSGGKHAEQDAFQVVVVHVD